MVKELENIITTEMFDALLPSVSQTIFYKKMIARIEWLSYVDSLPHLAYVAGASPAQKAVFGYMHARALKLAIWELECQAEAIAEARHQLARENWLYEAEAQAQGELEAQARAQDEAWEKGQDAIF